MEPSYSVWADWPSKFHTWPEGVQALWVLGLTLTALALIAGTTRVLVALVSLFRRPERPEAAGWRAGDAGMLFVERDAAPPALTDGSDVRRGLPGRARP